ncbi:chorismate synthase [uncultured Sanguibacteroides sp.]|uniref:chorismate synthase n=1 Tax=uncultured Sanguibacteroides sp. TaxID=1635151 RepID=UPI0025F7103F|nr:chorismate synthase [uncultured Sanguibacteroides sp.]
MAGNTIGKLYTLTSFGESHGKAIGGVVDGCPAGVRLSIEAIQQELDRRRPGQSDLTTGRNEQDRLEIFSGIWEGVTTGMPIGFSVHNEDQRSEDYDALKEVYRPSHSDYAWLKKYGIRDYRGGGRASAREHIARVVGGAIARQVLALQGISVQGYTSRIGAVCLERDYRELDLNRVMESAVGCPDPEVSETMIRQIQEVKQAKDSVGGIVSCVIRGVPVGVGEPVFDRLQARLAYYMLSINAAKGFEYGEGFKAASFRGSEHNDSFRGINGEIHAKTNHAGGILGGVSSGEDIYFNVAFKPVSTIGLKQDTVNMRGENVVVEGKGRHDPCVVPRAIPVVEAMAAMAVLDLMLEGNLLINFENSL